MLRSVHKTLPAVHPRLVSTVGALALALLVTACGKDEAPPPQTEQSGADTLAPLLDEINRQKPPQLKPAALQTLTQILSFSGVNLGDDLTLPIIISNDGDEPLTLQEIRLAGEGEVFTLGGACAAGLVLDPSRNSCRIDVTFRPAEARQYETSVVVVHSGTNSPLLVTVTGQGNLPQQVRPLPNIQPAPPSGLLLNALRVQQQRRGGNLDVLRTEGIPLQDWNTSAKDYGGIGFEPTESTLPVDRTRMITNDRYIPAVLETNINSEIPNGPAVAVIENHVYSAEGRNILIPAGSRVRGQYEGLNKANDNRIAVNWVRVIRPDGVGINIQNSPALDAMGRLGMIGYVDRRYFDRYVVPLMISSFGVGLQYALSEGDVTITRSTWTLGLGGETTTETLTREAQAGRALAEATSETAARYLEEQVNTTPVIFIPSGTRFVIMPTQDIVLKKPTLMTPADERESLTQMAQNLIAGLQRGELDQSSMQLVKVLAETAAQANGATRASGDAALQNAYGPPKTQ